MISTTSLQAFSAPAATARPDATRPIQQARAQTDTVTRQAAPQAVPEVRPGLPPPRGSLLNLSV